MTTKLRNVPLAVLLVAVGALAMFPPAILAAATGDVSTAEDFFYSGAVFLTLFVLLAIATHGRHARRKALSHLLALVAAFTLLPLMLAVPFHIAVGNTRFLSSWFEMVSSLTTTGATLFLPDRLPDAVHLWRALVGWLGGFLMWVTAIAILAPLTLGGYEVVSGDRMGDSGSSARQITSVAGATERLARYSGDLAPIYGGLTLLLWMALLSAGEPPLNAICHAMSTLSTSGISPTGGPLSGRLAEAFIFVFLIFALSRATFTTDASVVHRRGLRQDPELRMGLALVTIVPLLLFLRHWIGALDIDEQENLPAMARALWGGLFTTMSFLTTTGFQSQDWADVRAWSGLETPGLVLMGLALVGGGVATTAGGVKLLRIHALYMHGRREMEKLVHPHSIGGSGSLARRIRRRGAYIAWIFFMLFALSITLSMAALTLAGQSFEESAILTIAALSTTGPLAAVAGEVPIRYGDLGDAARVILGLAMIVGRLETLALIAIFNPDIWRN
ncbi:TrkH family potassium uptake protein [Mesobaculum littorinae]|uniref:TrkH family potassium uptake protein n=1 Tax=Mesobaculum littorinae TaxID=2486419 RepID=A0A438AMG9_9RHOB|nr:potassium transporter TrkG [Mesobaculum littorinae]RVV99840.1 TrkH family potassium uptake protein [Mesobaculum littorinae]